MFGPTCWMLKSFIGYLHDLRSWCQIDFYSVSLIYSWLHFSSVWKQNKWLSPHKGGMSDLCIQQQQQLSSHFRLKRDITATQLTRSANLWLPVTLPEAATNSYLGPAYNTLTSATPSSTMSWSVKIPYWFLFS